MLKKLVICLTVLCAFPCQAQQPVETDTLTGTVIRKPWSKSAESWNAGGSEYYVLQMDEAELPPEWRNAAEGVILRPSEAVPFTHFADFTGQVVKCEGEFVAGKPYQPPEDVVEQMPVVIENPLSGEPGYPLRGSGFKVYAITPFSPVVQTPVDDPEGLR